MPNTMNRAILHGAVQRDPEVVILPQGQRKVARFSLLTAEEWKDAAGVHAEGGEMHKIVVYNDRIADFVDRFVRRGSRVLVEGQIKTRRYTDARGVDRAVTEIVLGARWCSLELTSTKAERLSRMADLDQHDTETQEVPAAIVAQPEAQL